MYTGQETLRGVRVATFASLVFNFFERNLDTRLQMTPKIDSWQIFPKKVTVAMVTVSDDSHFETLTFIDFSQVTNMYQHLTKT